VAAGTVIANSASVASSATDNTPGNNTSTASATVSAAPTVPTLSTFGAGVLILLLASCGVMLQRRERGSSI